MSISPATDNQASVPEEKPRLPFPKISKKKICKAIQDLGPSWVVQDRQVEIIAKILKAFQTTDDVVLEAPTGVGKSLIGVIVSKFVEQAYFATAEKVLQDQYAKSFTCDVLKGADNYPCTIFNGATAATSPCRALLNIRKTCGQGCDYFRLRERAKDSKMLLSNYQYFAIEFDFVKQFPKKDLVVFDEAHNAESILSEYASVTLTVSTLEILKELASHLKAYTKTTSDSAKVSLDPKDVAVIYELATMPIPIGFSNGLEEATRALPAFRKFYATLHQATSAIAARLQTGFAEVEFSLLTAAEKQLLAASGALPILRSIWMTDRLHCKWSNYLENDHLDWILDATPEGLKLIPDDVAYYSKKILQPMATKRLWMSATLGHAPSFIRTHGLETPKLFQLDSSFPEENRKIFLMSLTSINHQFMQDPTNFQTLALQVAHLIRAHLGENGIIHSGSYSLTRAIVPHLKVALQDTAIKLHIPETARDRQACLEAFERDGGVIISPSLMQGIDLKYELSRFQIILKVPYLSMVSALVEHKFKTNKEWYANQAAIQILQAAGRSVRTETDAAVTYILDRNVTFLVEFFPKWFKIDCTRARELRDLAPPTSEAKTTRTIDRAALPSWLF